MKRYYLTCESLDYDLYEHRGNIRGARREAEKYAEDLKETIYINDVSTEEIIECIFHN